MANIEFSPEQRAAVDRITQNEGRFKGQTERFINMMAATEGVAKLFIAEPLIGQTRRVDNLPEIVAICDPDKPLQSLLMRERNILRSAHREMDLFGDAVIVQPLGLFGIFTTAYGGPEADLVKSYDQHRLTQIWEAAPQVV